MELDRMAVEVRKLMEFRDRAEPMLAEYEKHMKQQAEHGKRMAQRAEEPKEPHPEQIQTPEEAKPEKPEE